MVPHSAIVSNKRQPPPLKLAKRQAPLLLHRNQPNQKPSLAKCLQTQYMRAQPRFLFSKIRPGPISLPNLIQKWCKPTTTNNGARLLDCLYKYLMSKMLKAVRSSRGGNLSIDDATNQISESMSNIIMHPPTFLFL